MLYLKSLYITKGSKQPVSFQLAAQSKLNDVQYFRQPNSQQHAGVPGAVAENRAAKRSVPGSGSVRPDDAGE